jgi:hypothetical protein
MVLFFYTLFIYNVDHSGMVGFLQKLPEPGRIEYQDVRQKQGRKRQKKNHQVQNQNGYSQCDTLIDSHFFQVPGFRCRV